MRAIPCLIVALLTAGTPGCGGETGTTPAEPDPVLSSLVVVPNPVSVVEGDSVALQVQGFDDHGNPFPVPTTSWTVRNGRVAAIDANGQVTGIEAGTTTVTASAAGVSTTVDLAVSSFVEPTTMQLGDMMIGYLAPGATDSIGLNLLENETYQFHGSTTGAFLRFSARAAGGQERGHLEVASVGASWYSPVYQGRSVAHLLVSLPESAAPVFYTFGIDSIDNRPESVQATITPGDTLRGESLGTPNGDRDSFVLEGAPSVAVRVSVRLGPEWAGRRLFITGFGEITPVGGEGWLTRGPIPLPPGLNTFEFLVPQPWGEGFTLPYEVVFEVESTGPLPEQVTDLAVRWGRNGGANLTWTAVDDGLGVPAGYTVQAMPVGGAPLATQASSQAQGTCPSVRQEAVGEQVLCELRGLDPTREFDFRVVSTRGPLAGPASNPVRASAGPFTFVDFEHRPDGVRTCLACSVGTLFEEWGLSFSFAVGSTGPTEPSLTWSVANPADAPWNRTVDFAKLSSLPFDPGRRLGTTRMDVLVEVDSMTFEVLLNAALSPQVQAFDRTGAEISIETTVIGAHRNTFGFDMQRVRVRVEDTDGIGYVLVGPSTSGAGVGGASIDNVILYDRE